MDIKVEVTAMTAGSTIVEPQLITVVAIQDTPKVVAVSGLSFIVPSVGGNSISAINPEFLKVGALV